MSTKLSRYADGLMEAAWLAALIVVPLFFNIYSSRIFEPDKITLLRTLALVILAAWLVKLVEEGGFLLLPVPQFWDLRLVLIWNYIIPSIRKLEGSKGLAVVGSDMVVSVKSVIPLNL